MNTILLVEPEPMLRDLLRRQLAGRYEILQAASPVEAIDFCRAHREIDALIADADLGLVSGVELTSLLRAWIPRLKAVLLSDYPGDSWTDRQLAELKELPPDVALILRKPFPPRALDAALNQLVPAPPAAVAV
jgi:CheY-like chemotaxis protein